MKRPASAPADEDGTGLKKSRSGDDSPGGVVYQPGCVVVPDLEKKMNSLVEVQLPPKYLVSDSKQVKLRQLWGTDVYTDDSDLVAVLVHTGHVKLKTTPPKTSLLVSLRVCPTQTSYASVDRNGLKSREWSGKHAGVSFKVERCLQDTAGAQPPSQISLLKPAIQRQIPGSVMPMPPGPGGHFAVPAPACVAVFNLCNEPALKYSLPLVADQGTDDARWTSTRLRREALYLESRTRRFELALTGSADGYDSYTLSQVRKAHSLDRRAMEGAGVPLPAEHVKPLHEGIDWEELVWGPCFLRVRGEEYPLVNVLFMPRTLHAA